jgi:hypothetical protein
MIFEVKKLTPKIFKRIVTKIEFGDCWIWTGSKDEQGYGMLWYEGRSERIHRLMYAYFVEPVPRGVRNRKFGQIDHMCRNTSCCNPNHLELVTQKTNILRGNGVTAENARKIKCINGHYLENTKNGKRRWCRTCDKRR